MARALCLIVVPVLFYMFMFQIHFWILNHSGEGDGFMSSEFQHTLGGHGMDDTQAGKLFDGLQGISLSLLQMLVMDQAFPFDMFILKEDICIHTIMHILAVRCVS